MALHAWFLLALSLFLPSAAVAGFAADGLSTAQTERKLSTFFEAYLGRPLTAKERRAAAKAYIGYFEEDGCRTRCADSLKTHLENARTFEEKTGSVEDLTLRQRYLQANVYGEKPTPDIILSLLEEPDPIAVRNPSVQRLMTRRDAVAFVALRRLMKTGEWPKAQTIPAAELSKLVDALEQSYGSKAPRLPVRLALAAEMRAGLESLWQTLSSGEKEAVRLFLEDGSTHPLTVSLWAKILALPEEEAQAIAEADQLDRSYEALYQTMNDALAVARLQAQWSVIDYLAQQMR